MEINLRPRLVQIVIEFGRIGEIDTMNEKYQAEINIEAKWATNENIDTYDPNKHWNPKLYIENAFQEPKESIKYNLNKDNSGFIIVTEQRSVKGAFWERLELQNFPFDVQELSITLASKLDSNEIKLDSDSSRISKINFKASHTFIDQQKWRLFKLVKISHIASYDVQESGFKIHPIDDNIILDEIVQSPKLVASCFCARKAGYYFFNAFFLIFLITVTTFAIFGIDAKLPQNRVAATVSFLLTSISFKWVFNRSLPTISYLTSLDLYSIICIFFICCMCAWHSIVGSNWTKEEAKEIDKWGLVGFACVFFMINGFFLIWLFVAYSKIRKLAKQESEFLKELKIKKPNNLSSKL